VIAIDLFIYSLAAFGLAYIVGWSKLSLPLRERLNPKSLFLALLECPACLGTWVGFAAGYWAWSRGFSSLGWQMSVAVGGLYTCASNLILARLTGLLEGT
jgi:hypothetical protein